MDSFSDINEYDHRFLDEWILIEEEMRREALLQEFLPRDNPNDGAIISPESMFGQPASFPSLFSQAQNLPGTHECALPSTQPIFSAQLEPSVSMMDYFMESVQEFNGIPVPSFSTTNVETLTLVEPNLEDQNVKVSTKKPKARKTVIAQSTRRSTRVRIPKIIPDSIMELPIKKTRLKKKVAIPLNSTPFGNENFNEELFKKREANKEQKLENYESESLNSKKTSGVIKLKRKN